MSALTRLDVDRLRNLKSVSIEPHEHVNILVGSNGSGKTSLLEAIHLLALGRSFRSARVDPLIAFESPDLVIHARFSNGDRAGLVKRRNGPQTLKLNDARQRNWQELARALPVQLLNSDTFALLDGGARMRRRYLDWGVFHVEHGFLTHWRNAAKALAQRNALLKRGADSDQLAAWDEEFCRAATQVDDCRRRYFRLLEPHIHTAVGELFAHVSALPDLVLDYQPGWSEELPLSEVLLQNRTRDLKTGATQAGPHRCDISVRIGRNPAASVLSRGQQKLLVTALKLAQSRFFQSQWTLLHGAEGTGPPPLVYLIDDLAAELDQTNCQLVTRHLLGLGSQLFFTAVAEDDLNEPGLLTTSASKFHVEHGKIDRLK